MCRHLRIWIPTYSSGYKNTTPECLHVTNGNIRNLHNMHNWCQEEVFWVFKHVIFEIWCGRPLRKHGNGLFVALGEHAISCFSCLFYNPMTFYHTDKILQHYLPIISRARSCHFETGSILKLLYNNHSRYNAILKRQDISLSSFTSGDLVFSSFPKY